MHLPGRNGDALELLVARGAGVMHDDAPKRAKAVGAVSQATGQLHGALQGVDAVETMVADVQGGTAVLAGVALDIEH